MAILRQEDQPFRIRVFGVARRLYCGAPPVRASTRPGSAEGGNGARRAPTGEDRITGSDHRIRLHSTTEMTHHDDIR